MRYIGSKETLIEPIMQLLADKGLHQRNMVFFDAFCGMGSVSDSIKTLIQNFAKAFFIQIIPQEVLIGCILQQKMLDA